MMIKVVLILMLGGMAISFELRGFQTFVSFFNGDFWNSKASKTDSMTIEELGQSKGYCFYDFVDYVSYRYRDRDCSLYDNEIAHLLEEQRGNNDRKPPIMVKCLPNLGNGTLIMPERVLDVISLLKPIGNATKRAEEGSCVLILFYTESCPSCARVAPVFNVLPKLFQTFKIAAIDAYKFPTFNTEFGIVGLPTVLLFHQGRPIVKLANNDYEFSKFLTRHTSIKPTPLEKVLEMISSNDIQGPLPTTVKEGPDYYLFMAWMFILLCFGNYFAKSRMCQKIIEMVKRNWHESEVQLEQNT